MIEYLGLLGVLALALGNWIELRQLRRRLVDLETVVVHHERLLESARNPWEGV